jgi:hypothetical protein
MQPSESVAQKFVKYLCTAFSIMAASNNWFRSENEDLRMDGKVSEVSSIEINPSIFRNEASRRCRPFAAENQSCSMWPYQSSFKKFL